MGRLLRILFPLIKKGLADYISGFIANISNGINSDIDKKAILEGLRQYCGFSFMVWILDYPI